MLLGPCLLWIKYGLRSVIVVDGVQFVSLFVDAKGVSYVLVVCLTVCVTVLFVCCVFCVCVAECL